MKLIVYIIADISMIISFIDFTKGNFSVLRGGIGDLVMAGILSYLIMVDVFHFLFSPNGSFSYNLLGSPFTLFDYIILIAGGIYIYMRRKDRNSRIN